MQTVLPVISVNKKGLVVLVHWFSAEVNQTHKMHRSAEWKKEQPFEDYISFICPLELGNTMLILNKDGNVFVFQFSRLLGHPVTPKNKM